MTDLTETHFSDLMAKGFSEFRDKYLKLAKTKSIANLYVQFTRNPEAMDRNPHGTPDHSDPVGVYGYPMDYVLKHPADIWYGGAAPYLRVLEDRSRNKLVLPDDISDEREAVRTLRYCGMSFEDAERAFNMARKTYRDRAKRPSQVFMSALQMDVLGQPTGKNNWTEKLEYRTRTGLEQTQMLRRAGFDSIEDRARRATQATINDREPEQIIFLHRGAFRVLEVINLRSPTTPQHKLPPMTTTDPSAAVTERPLVAKLAQMMGDKLLSGSPERSNLMGWSYYWTQKGRRIEIEFPDRTDRSDYRMGEKKHRAAKLNTAHEIAIRIKTEKGEISGDYDEKARFKDVVIDLTAEWEGIANGPDTSWEPETRATYHQKIKDERMARIQVKLDQEKAELLRSMPEILDSTVWLAERYGHDFRPSEDEETNYWFVRGLGDFARITRRKSDVDPVKHIAEHFFDAPKPAVALHLWTRFAPTIRAIMADPEFENYREVFFWEGWPETLQKKIEKGSIW